MLDSNVTSLHGKDHLESIDVTNVKTGQTVQVPVSALFVAIGQEPDNQIFSDIVELDEKGYIKAGADCKTSHPGRRRLPDNIPASADHCRSRWRHCRNRCLHISGQKLRNAGRTATMAV